jgi:hypothetical protein
MNRIALRGLFFAAVLGWPAWIAQAQVPTNVALVLSCTSPPTGGVEEFLKAGSSSARFRFYIGDPGIQSPLLEGLPTVFIALYSPDEKRAALSQAVVLADKKWVLAALDVWLLRRRGEHWQVTHGDGSAGVWRSVEEFVQSLDRRPLLAPAPGPGPGAACVPYSEWTRQTSKYAIELARRGR